MWAAQTGVAYAHVEAEKNWALGRASSDPKRHKAVPRISASSATTTPISPATAAMALSSSRPHLIMRPFFCGFHASAQALARVETHDFSKPSEYLGSWEPSAAGDPREAWAQLERLRKGYARDVRDLRRQYAYEVQLLEAERQRKAEARAEAARIANEERKAAKAAAAQTRAAERRAFELDFRQALVLILHPFLLIALLALFTLVHNLFVELPRPFGLVGARCMPYSRI